MKQAALVVLGLVVSYVVYMLICFYVLEKYLHIGGCAAMGPGFLIIMPLSLLAGSMVTGFLSRPLLDTKWGLIWIAPGLYLAILTLFIFLPFAFIDGVGSISEILLTLLFSLYWYLASLAGVGLGYFLRGLIRHLRESD
jgi:hypothetical protein